MYRSNLGRGLQALHELPVAAQPSLTKPPCGRGAAFGDSARFVVRQVHALHAGIQTLPGFVVARW